MAQTKFQPGDVVKLKSGGPSMTVYFSDESATTCYFFDEGNKEVKMLKNIPTVVLMIDDSKQKGAAALSGMR